MEFSDLRQIWSSGISRLNNFEYILSYTDNDKDRLHIKNSKAGLRLHNFRQA